MSLSARILVLSLLTCSALGQSQKPSPSASPSPSVAEVPKTASKIPQTTVEDSANGADASTAGSIEILSDTMGVDFKPYISRIKTPIRRHWLEIMPHSAMAPEMKSGTVVVRFAILRDGRVASLRLEEKSGDVALDRAAYGAVSYSAPLPALPRQFAGDYLVIRARFLYNPDAQAKRDAQPQPESGSKPKPDTPKQAAHP